MVRLVPVVRPARAVHALVLAAVVLLSGCGGAATAGASQARFPGQEDLSGEQLLEVVLDGPGIVGLVVGDVVGGREDGPGRFATWSLRVREVVGGDPALYRQGVTIDLVAPQEPLLDTPPPTFDDGERVGVPVQRASRGDHGAPDDTTDRLVVLTEDNVARYDGDRVRWGTFDGPVRTFESVLARNPSGP